MGAAGREGIAVDAPADIEAGKDPVLAAAAVARHADRADGDAEIVARPAVAGLVILRAGGGKQYCPVALAALQDAGGPEPSQKSGVRREVGPGELIPVTGVRALAGRPGRGQQGGGGN